MKRVLAIVAVCALSATSLAAQTTGRAAGESGNASFPHKVIGSNGVEYFCNAPSGTGGLFSTAGLSSTALVGLGILTIAIIGAIANDNDDSTVGTN